MVPPRAVVMEAAQMMEAANVTTISTQLIAQVSFLCTIQSLNFFESSTFKFIFTPTIISLNS